MRRFGSPPSRNRTYRERPGAYAVIAGTDGILVTEETSTNVEIQLPGGGIDPGETPIIALHREALEETGQRIRVERRLGVYQRYTYMPDYDLWARKICHVFLCRPGLTLGKPTERHHRALWMSPAEAVVQLASPGDAWFVREVLAGRL